CKIPGDIFGGSFIRVPNSGAFIGGKNAIRRDILSAGQVRSAKGDIIPPDFMPKLVLESKWYKEFRFHGLMKPGAVPLLDEWIEQTLTCVQDGDVPFVCFKINLRGWFVAAPCTVDGSHDYEVGNHCVYANAYGKFIVTELEPFFTMNKDLIMTR